MRRLISWAYLVLPSCLAAQRAAASPTPRIFIKAGHLIDGRADQAQANLGILIEGERIKAVGPVAQLLYQSIPYRAILAARNARLSLEHGFTALRDVETEGAMYADVDVKLAVNRGAVPGPRLFVSTRAMAPTGMYPIVSQNWELEVPNGVQPVDGVDGARLAVREQVSHGADWIKYYSDRRYYFAPDSTLRSWVNSTDEEAKAIVDV